MTESLLNPKLRYLIQYRFSDDLSSTIREYVSTPTWDEDQKAICLIPTNTFPGKEIIILSYPRPIEAEH